MAQLAAGQANIFQLVIVEAMEFEELPFRQRQLRTSWRRVEKLKVLNRDRASWATYSRMAISS